MIFGKIHSRWYQKTNVFHDIKCDKMTGLIYFMSIYITLVSANIIAILRTDWYKKFRKGIIQNVILCSNAHNVNCLWTTYSKYCLGYIFNDILQGNNTVSVYPTLHFLIISSVPVHLQEIIQGQWRALNRCNGKSFLKWTGTEVNIEKNSVSDVR